MKKIILVASVVIIGSCLAIFFLIRYDNKRASQMIGNSSVVIDGETILVERAATPAAQARGLSGRTAMCQDCGMLFTFDSNGVYPFWMKEMNFDLDMLWITDGKIVQIDKDVPHTGGTAVTRTPNVPVDDVLELNAGASDRLGFRIGDTVAFDFK